jgi:hypothetical protein
MHLQTDYFSQYHIKTKVVPNIASCVVHVEVTRTKELSYPQIYDTPEYDLQILINILCVYY